MRKNFLALALFVFAIAGFLALAATSPSFAASQASKAGVSFSLSGQYVGKLLWAQNQAQSFSNSPKSADRNTFQTLLQRVRLSSKISYDKLSHGMPLAMLAVQVDLTNAYNGITNGLGSNGWYALGGTPAPLGFNHDFNTFGLRLAYLRVITPIGAIMVGRMPVKFGLGIAVNTDADGLGDFMPIGNIGVFAGVLFGSEVSAYNTPQSTSTPPSNNVYNVGIYPPTGEGYTHMQVGTIPTIEIMTLKPINNISYSAWLTEAHLNQFGTKLSEIAKVGTVTVYSPTTTISSYYPTANITFGGLSATYSKAGTKLAGEVDYFQGRIIASNQAISTGLPLSYFLPVSPSGGDQYDAVNSYDLYLTGSKMLSTPIPVSVGFKFGIGAPIAAGHFNFTYYSQTQQTRTLFGNVIGSNWQAIQMSAPGNSYIYGHPLGSNLANKYGIMVDAQEFLPSGNTLQESLIHAAWLQDSLNGSQEFGGKAIGTEFDVNFTHHFTKTLAWQAWGGYVWTGSGVESTSPTGTTAKPFAGAEHKDVTALGSAFIWNF